MLFRYQDQSLSRNHSDCSIVRQDISFSQHGKHCTYKHFNCAELTLALENISLTVLKCNSANGLSNGILLLPCGYANLYIPNQEL